MKMSMCQVTVLLCACAVTQISAQTYNIMMTNYVTLCACAVTQISAQTYNIMMTNYAALLQMYSSDSSSNSTTDFIPMRDLTSTMYVQADMILYTLNDFDEVAGNLELSASLKLSWTDNIVDAYHDGFLNNSDVFQLDTSFNASATANTLQVPYNKIWTPKLVLRNSINSFSAIGNDAYMCRFNLTNGHVEWQPRILINSACSPDVTYYPFDRQSCSFTFLSWGFTSSELTLRTVSSEWDVSAYEDNGVWDFVKTGIESLVEGDQSVLKMTFTLQRKPLYFAFNIILPVLLLCILNGMVFLLPEESGERVGFSVTCFLSFMVLLNMIMDILPRSSSPMSYLCYYLVVMMIFSGAETALVVLQMRLFHKPDTEKVPGFLRAILSCWLGCSRKTSKVCCGEKRKTNNKSHHHRVHVKRSFVEPVEPTRSHTPDPHCSTSSHFVDENKIHVHEGSPITHRVSHDQNGDCKLIKTTHGHTEEDHHEHESKHKDDREKADVTWQDVARFFDTLFFFTFLGVELFFTITFLMPLGFRV